MKTVLYYCFLMILLPTAAIAAPPEVESDAASKVAGKIYYAIWHEDIETAKAALAANANTVNSNAVNSHFEKNWTLLHWAAEHGSSNGVAILNLLLANGAKVDAKNHIGGTPLFATTISDNAEGAKILIAHGASVNVRPPSGRTPLHCAALNGCPKVVKVLIENKAAINIRDSDGKTPLDWALEEQKDAVKSGDAKLIKRYNEVIAVLRESRAKE